VTAQAFACRNFCSQYGAYASATFCQNGGVGGGGATFLKTFVIVCFGCRSI
jgi:hypothetical protein